MGSDLLTPQPLKTRGLNDASGPRTIGSLNSSAWTARRIPLSSQSLKVLLGPPCLIRSMAGLGDLAALTGQPTPDLDRLPARVWEHAVAPPTEAASVRGPGTV